MSIMRRSGKAMRISRNEGRMRRSGNEVHGVMYGIKHGVIFGDVPV